MRGGLVVRFDSTLLAYTKHLRQRPLGHKSSVYALVFQAADRLRPRAGRRQVLEQPARTQQLLDGTVEWLPIWTHTAAGQAIVSKGKASLRDLLRLFEKPDERSLLSAYVCSAKCLIFPIKVGGKLDVPCFVGGR